MRRSDAWPFALLLVCAAMSWWSRSVIPALLAAVTFAVAWILLWCKRSNDDVRASSARVERILIETFPDE